MKYSIVIPVYNSERVVGETVGETLKYLKKKSFDYEIILVNDGSTDNSWQAIKSLAKKSKKIKAINLLKNYGQHTATLCGLQKSSGNYAITIDDDLQNPPDEIDKLIKKADENHDLVFGHYKIKKHSFFRRLGSWIIQMMNEKIFEMPKGITTSNFRIIKNDVVKRMLEYRTNYPYIQGIALMFSESPAVVEVKHNERKVGKSNYSITKILKLVGRIFFNYSSYPLRLVSWVGFPFSLIALLFSGYYLVRALYLGISVPGWATIVIFVSFFSGITLFILGMLGEYIIRLVTQQSYPNQFFIIKEQVN